MSDHRVIPQGAITGVIPQGAITGVIPQGEARIVIPQGEALSGSAVPGSWLGSPSGWLRVVSRPPWLVSEWHDGSVSGENADRRRS